MLREASTLPAVAALLVAGAVAAAAGPDPAALDTWWASATALHTGDTAYRVEGATFQDGACTAEFQEGVFVPVYSGRAPVSERLVGLLFMGTGSLRVDLDRRADAWGLANHLVLAKQAEKAEMAAVAHGDAPFTAGLDRALLLTADPSLEQLLYGLDPLGGGVSWRPSDEAGVDEEYVVTDRKGRLRALALTTNLLPDRRRLLVHQGLDPVAMLRQDRLLVEELGVPGEQARLLAEFRLDRRLGVAAQEGRVLGPMAWDRWLTCFRDGAGYSGSGFTQAVFAHGLDQDGNRHFQRFAGAVAPSEAPRPAGRLDAVRADVSMKLRSANFFGNAIKAQVDSHLVFRAPPEGARWVALRLPRDHAIPGTWTLDALELEDGTPLAWVDLSVDPSTAVVQSGGGPGAAPEGQVATGEVTGTTTSSSGDAPEAPEAEAVSGGLLESVRTEDVLFDWTRYRYEILVLLPEPVPGGQEVGVHLAWTARWQYANWSDAGQPLGATTGNQPFLPEVLGDPGGTAWAFTARAQIPMTGLRSYGLALSGDTVEEGADLEGSGLKWVVARGEHARSPAVAVGGWRERNEPAAQGCPAVRVHLFPKVASALPVFAPEVRRVVVFMERMLPPFPFGEVEVVQGPSTFLSTVQAAGLREDLPGLVALRTVRSGQLSDASGMGGEVTDAAYAEAEDPHLAQTQLARGVAGQYWGQRLAPASFRDAWIPSALADAYAAFYVRAAEGRDAWDQRLQGLRARLEDEGEEAGSAAALHRWHRSLSLTGAMASSDVSGKLRGDYALYVVAEMLRRRLGDEPFFRTLDVLAARPAGTRLTTEDLQAALERGTGADLDDFFDAWIHGGYIPALELRWAWDPATGAVSGVVCSDIPFGLLDVPVLVAEVTGEDAERRRRKARVELTAANTGQVVAGPVRVEDGLGAFSAAGFVEEPRVDLDPEHLVLARDRKVRQVEGAPSCE